ncbi:translocation/assembly module TamB domain-containing protein [Sphingomonas canadensis]|uniref:Translocation/assembly module TamB domain-containing protein n=1 Tax=Sphingomonas canadensis TaxID=1219257 RepID=A0ABW3HA94_9SPHN|nr:translocation/assembly module TamB [Sphingomonas canadensis]MCW3838070.1 translocation/assembly module TamB [Sphingomonas canadensis]
MAGEEPAVEAAPPQVEDTPARPRRGGWARAGRWAAGITGGVAALAGAGLLWLDSAMGHAFLARQISGMVLESGLNFRVERIEGSVFGAMELRGVEARDPRGGFASADRVAVDWRPWRWFSNRIDIRSAAIPLVRLARLPELKTVPRQPNEPLLPEIGIELGRLDIARIEIAPAVTGRAHAARLNGSVHIADGRAVVTAEGAALAGPGLAGGDRMSLKLDAVPASNRLDMALRVAAPADGLAAALTGVAKPLALSVEGAGSWQRWRGLAVGSLGGEELANLAVTADDGRFTLRGPVHAGLWLEGPAARLAGPVTDVAIEARWADRRAATRFDVKSQALAVHGEGLIDLRRSRFGDFRVEALLRTPGTIAERLSGRDVRLAVALDGPFATPMVDYKLRAAMLGFGETLVEGLAAEGRARVDANRMRVPVRAVAARVTGLNDAAGSLLTNLTVSGDLAIAGSQILSDNLRLVSDRVNATAILIADVSAGRYTGAIKGRVNDYELDGLALVNLETDAKLYTPPAGGWGIRGGVSARSVKILNEGVRSFLGGNAAATADVGIDQQGIVSFANVRLRAPLFEIRSGQGSYDPAGPIQARLDGQSVRFGALSADVSGRGTAPEVVVRAPSPGVGVGMTGLVARIRGEGQSWAITADGGTDYGPFAADVLVTTGKRTVVDVRGGRFAGMVPGGRLVQGAAGPFEGVLSFAGSGITGSATLSAQGALQYAAFTARAANAQVPGAAELTIGQAIADGSILFAEVPQIIADVQVANLRQRELTLRTARAKIDYQGGKGSAQLLATGSTGVPFRIAANADLKPGLWRVAVDGQGSGVKFKTRDAARIKVLEDGYELQPVRVDLDQGTALLSGTYGAGYSVKARLERLDLAVVNAFVPGLGIGGSATGSLDFAQDSPSAFPSANARLEISNFTRASIARVSDPVNLTLVGKLLPDGGDARALIKRGSTTIGRMVATLRPLGPEAGPWRDRLMAAPLSGGIRYNGPAAVLFSLAGLTGQQLSGPIGVAADFSGRVATPELSGIVRASNLTYENETYGTHLTAMKIEGQFTNDKLVIQTMTAQAGSGTVGLSGSVGLSSAAGFPMNLTAELRNARLARSDALGATATGRIRVIRDEQGPRIEGRIDLPEVRYEVVRQGAAEIPELTGIRRKSDVFATEEQRKAARQTFGDFRLNLRIRADNRVFINGMGLESEWATSIRIGGSTAAPELGGTATLVRGTYDFGGRRFTLTRGVIRFQGRDMTNPTIDIAGNTDAEGITAVLIVSGSAQRPRIAFTSSPALPQDEVLARLLFGNSVTDLTAVEAVQLAAALNSLRGSGGLNPLGKLRSAVGIDRLRILSADATSGRGTAIAAGQYITDDIYVEVITDARGFTATQLEVALSQALSVLSYTGSFGGTGVSLRYSKDY